MGAAAAVLLIKERHIVEAMERIGATSPARALTLDQLSDLGVDDRGFAWHALRNRVIVREASPGQWYLDAEVWQAARRRRHRVLFLILALVALAVAVTFLSANRIAQ
jgi:hypothetical protein